MSFKEKKYAGERSERREGKKEIRNERETKRKKKITLTIPFIFHPSPVENHSNSYSHSSHL